MITQLVYTSSSAFDTRARQGRSNLGDILDTARAFNSANDITGFLIVGSDWFAQVLEGEPTVIDSLFRRILRDPRHHQVKLVETRMVAARRFADWAMGSSNVLPDGTRLSTVLQWSKPDATLDFAFDRILRCASELSGLQKLRNRNTAGCEHPSVA